MHCKRIMLLLLAAVSLPALAAEHTSVEQLKQTLQDAQRARLSDGETVRRLANVELDERLGPALLSQLTAASPGPRTTEVLRALADASLFAEPPVSEIPAAAQPDFTTQRAILARTIHYVARVLPSLPNFMATRATRHYDDGPAALEPGGWPVRAGMHLAGSFDSLVSFMDGGEGGGMTAPSATTGTVQKVSAVRPSGGATLQQRSSGLNSWGEIRTLLGIVLVDSAKGKVSWRRWERVGEANAAVFQFQVERGVSHYDVRFSRSLSTTGSGKRSADKAASPYFFHQTSGYHGQLVVDPETGAVLRVIIDADMEQGSPVYRASMLVEYAPVNIGPRVCTCPVRSIAVSASDEVFQATSQSPFEDLVESQVNESTFTGYHQFGSEATFAAASEESGRPVASASAAPATGSLSASETPAAASATVPSGEVAGAPPAAAEAPISPAEEEADQEILIRAVESMPGEEDEPADDSSGGGGKTNSLTFKSTSRLVSIGLVALDKHGKPITDLRQADIEVYDNGRKQQMSAFHHAEPEPAAPSLPPQPALAADTFTNAATRKIDGQDAPDLLILLLDENHLAYQDLNRARSEVLRFLAATRPTSRIAIYATGEGGFRVIQDVTQDHALATKKLGAWVPDAQSVAAGQAVDRRLRQQFDTVHTQQDLNSVNGNYTETPDAVTSIDPELRQMGQNPLRAALEGMLALSRHFAPVPGHKCMAWITGDSALANWEDQAVGMEKTVSQMGSALQRTKESLNEGQIALYVVDASGVTGDGIDPSLEFRNVELNQAAKDNTALLGGGGPRNSTAGRITGEMQQDLRGIQGPVRDLAESTGGRAVRKGSDLKEILDGIDEDSKARYELAFAPDTAADGKFHSLLVKIPNRKDVKLRYRTGYLYQEESATTKQRFQQTIWSPQDATELELTAEALKPAEGAANSAVKLKIGFPGIALEQKAGRWTDQLYIFIAQRDDAAQKADVSGDTLRLSLKQATYDAGSPIPYTRALEAKSKLGSVRVIVVDGNSGKMSSVTLPAAALHP